MSFLPIYQVTNVVNIYIGVINSRKVKVQTLDMRIFSLVWFILFNGLSSFVCYLMLKPSF